MREVTDAEGHIVWAGYYKAWGRVAANVSPEASGFEQHLRLPGQYYDAESGLHYNTFRYYDPKAARFISPDPIGLAGGLNLYQYAPNPLRWMDPLGLSCGSDARALRRNMIAYGKTEPGFKNSAHHIVMSNSKDPRMITLQTKMKNLDISINDARNGIFLPSNSKVEMPVGNTLPNHASIHGNEYKQNVFDRLNPINDKDSFLNELNKINSEIAAGIF